MGRQRAPIADAKTQATREANRRSYKKRGSRWSRMTDEQKKAQLAAVRLWKQRNKHRRTPHGYVHAEPVRLKTKKPAKGIVPDSKAKPGSEAWYRALKEKHRGFEGQRLEKSIKPPIFLHNDRGPQPGRKS
jgi:hypothetical protein